MAYVSSLDYLSQFWSFPHYSINSKHYGDVVSLFLVLWRLRLRGGRSYVKRKQVSSDVFFCKLINGFKEAANKADNFEGVQVLGRADNRRHHRKRTRKFLTTSTEHPQLSRGKWRTVSVQYSIIITSLDAGNHTSPFLLPERKLIFPVMSKLLFVRMAIISRSLFNSKVLVYGTVRTIESMMTTIPNISLV